MVKEEGSVKVPVKLEQAWKADAPIEVTLLPRANEPVKPEQYLKALYPIVFDGATIEEYKSNTPSGDIDIK
jgi:hypothetical protein